ncbi:Cytochrome P450 9c1 [Papilio machaon]|uniref:unspecific monooxygenase n=1 Tax=Papilio machaon TaxID=76193 RepID=A0A194RJE6_PAPMA|nr:Cytochrome P450 9c1 [Papilio machaon]
MTVADECGYFIGYFYYRYIAQNKSRAIASPDHVSEDLDVCDLMHRYTNDVIASCAFGCQVNSVKDKENEFYRTGQSLFELSTLQRTKLILAMYFPSIAKSFGLKVFEEKDLSFFQNLVKDTMEYREKNKIERPDMIQLLIQASNGSLKSDEADIKTEKIKREWSQQDLVAQVFVFFIAGFETSATTLSLTFHELAVNPLVQEKLYAEIKTLHDTKGKLLYDNINELKYLDCVINETLRKWSPALIMDRVCTKPYELPPPREGGKPTKLNPGDFVYNMVNSIHLDRKHYPEPDVYKPERFSEENKHEIKPFTFMPFGIGPRTCIDDTQSELRATTSLSLLTYSAGAATQSGSWPLTQEIARVVCPVPSPASPSLVAPAGLALQRTRFAMLEIKVLLYNLMLNFKILKCEKTTDPIVLKPHELNIFAQGGTWVKLEART